MRVLKVEIIISLFSTLTGLKLKPPFKQYFLAFHFNELQVRWLKPLLKGRGITLPCCSGGIRSLSED